MTPRRGRYSRRSPTLVFGAHRPLALLGLGAVFAFLVAASTLAQEIRFHPSSRGASKPGIATTELASVVTSELVGNGSSSLVAVDLGTTRGTRRVTSVPPVRTMLIRELPTLWEYWLPPGESPADISVHYRIHSASGDSDRLGHPQDPRSSIRVRIRAQRPEILETSPAGTVIQGGIVLELDIQDVHSAGRYRGVLTTTIDRL